MRLDFKRFDVAIADYNAALGIALSQGLGGGGAEARLRAVRGRSYGRASVTNSLVSSEFLVGGKRPSLRMSPAQNPAQLRRRSALICAVAPASRAAQGRALAYEGVSKWAEALEDYDSALEAARVGGFKSDPYILNSRGNVLVRGDGRRAAGASSVVWGSQADIGRDLLTLLLGSE